MEMPDPLAAARSLPRPMVLTNGVFDLLHCGHVRYLAQARALGASLVVGLNSDASARGLGKGPGRPLVPQADRACVLSALSAVSLVVLFDEPTPQALLEALRPEIYAKGGDYRLDELAEARQVQAWGGRAVVLPFLPGRSTTALVQQITRHGASPDPTFHGAQDD